MHVRAAAVAGILVLITLGMTWPLALHLTTSLPGDYGDPLFVTWVMGWVAGQITHALSDPGALQQFWNANIFFPEPRALAFSEHFIAQTLMVLPVYWMTGNLLLCYNLAFLASFVLTGLGAFLLARRLTGSAPAAAIAAFVATFNVYRIAFEVAHLHVLSIQWFPFVLLFLHRYVETDRRRWLAAAAAALVALNLSSIYYMAYCAPFVALFAVATVIGQRRWREPRVWLELWAAAAAVALITMPFLLPYVEVQQRLAIVRAPDEVSRFSATLDHYRAGLASLLAPLVLAAIGVAGVFVNRALRTGFAVATLALLLLLAFWLSLGPTIQSGGQTLAWPGLYGLLYEHVPGFSALRVPARYESLVFIFLGMLAAYGVAALQRRASLLSRFVVALSVAALVWTTPVGVRMNQPLVSERLAPPPPYLTPSTSPPAIYRAVDTLSAGAVLAEFPFGDSWYDLRYMYFSSVHRRRLLNGYSGLFPPGFIARQRVLTQPLLDPARAAQALAGATHVIVHRHGWKDNTGVLIGGWLEAFGARAIAESDGAVLYELARREDFAAK